MDLHDSYPLRMSTDFFVQPWLEELIKDKKVCVIGSRKGDAIVQISQKAKSVCGVDSDMNVVNTCKSRGLDVDLFFDNIPEADVHYCWPRFYHEVVDILQRGSKIFVFQSPNDWNSDGDLWDVQPDSFNVEPKFKEDKLKEFGEILGGELEFYAYKFEEPKSVRQGFPPSGWRQAFVFKRTKETIQPQIQNVGHPEVLLIVGNHRTGTSMLTKVLEMSGGYLCNPNSRVDEYNEKGYFENKQLLNLHSEAMRVLFGHAWFVKNLPPKHPVQRSEFYMRVGYIFTHIGNLIKSHIKSANGRFIIIKDPRISFLLPRYIQTLFRMGIKAKVIFSDRPDEEIIASIKHRNNFDEKEIQEHINASRQAVKDTQIDALYLSTFRALEYKPEKVLSFLSERLDLSINTDAQTMEKVNSFIDKGLRHHDVPANVKIMTTYFGPRRTRPTMIDDTIDWLMDVIEREIYMDKGVFADTIVVNHDIATHFEDGYKAHQYLDSIDGIPTRNGVIKTINRPWDKGIGGSFASFSFAFDKFRKDLYEYWFFTEDNVIQIAEGYFATCINQLNRSPNTAYIGCHRYMSKARRMHDHPLHAHGGCGCVSFNDVNKIFSKYGQLPYSSAPMPGLMADGIINTNYKLQDAEGQKWYRKFELEGEVMFTNIYVKEGLDVEDIDVDYPVVKHRGNVY